MSEIDSRHAYRWNSVVWVAETSIWMLATSLLDSTTVLPILLLTLTHAPLMAGLIISVRYAGQGWPQLISASLVSGRRYKRPYYFLLVIPGRLLLLWPALLLLREHVSAISRVVAICIAYFAFWVSEGLSIVPWTEMLGKTIPADRRGRLFGAMQGVGGVMGILAGAAVSRVLRRHGFPFGFGLLFAGATLCYAISTPLLGLLREPPGHQAEERYSTWALIKDIPNLLRAMPQFRLLVIIQALFGFAILPAPFYILYATHYLRRAAAGLNGELVGIGGFLAVQTLGMILGNLLWGIIADRRGNYVLLRLLALIHTVVPLLAVVGGFLAHQALSGWAIFLVFTPVFFSFGGLMGGTWTGLTNFLLEIAPAHDRPAYIAVINALNIPAIILPLLGGLAIRSLGAVNIFLLAAAVLAYSYLLTQRLEEPRIAAG